MLFFVTTMAQKQFELEFISVIFETSRLATIVNGVLRKTTQDMELNGLITAQMSKEITNLTLTAKCRTKAWSRRTTSSCLEEALGKVLRLWLERKILPESLLRQYMDDIGVSNDDASVGFFLRRPSRVERAVDDPIRDMEGMLVDEYGRLRLIEIVLCVPQVTHSDFKKAKDKVMFKKKEGVPEGICFAYF
ncbi:ENHANCER OF AG-4 protein 2 [Camellia lanceoleosa]|uniref:ENHANCER OF AG-4 protein 2 n=1 Tax=Camellia lanceoleosa TaxID=1840588 RepID=A0ACC0IDL4_9ERIC|nr:ENHANCER OF AG-4 protein 2 [Camellia lanceoleosa]